MRRVAFASSFNALAALKKSSHAIVAAAGLLLGLPNITLWQYNEAGTYLGDIAFSDPEALTTTFRLPDDAQPGQTIHIILEATDNGTPPITRYRRVIVRVQ
jgi:hypothetical protein